MITATRPSNLTPDAATGTGRYTERQIFNALRHGLQPAFAPDAELVPGGPLFPREPRYLAPTMPGRRGGT